MFKKVLILTLFISAYVLFTVHSMIPHQHNINANSTHHHHHDGSHSHHDDTDSEAPFDISAHDATLGNALLKNVTLSLDLVQVFVDDFIFSDFIVGLAFSEQPPPKQFSLAHSFFDLSSYYSAVPLRAPPF